jgi:hypothetical protein
MVSPKGLKYRVQKMTGRVASLWPRPKWIQAAIMGHQCSRDFAAIYPLINAVK